MIDPVILAYIFSTLMSGVVFFQLALAFGAPWGEYAMGGKYPGRFPPPMRVAALVHIVLLIFIALIVLTRAGLVFGEYFELSKVGVWFVVVFCITGVVLNAITPSKKERMLWVPVAVALLICSVAVAMS